MVAIPVACGYALAAANKAVVEVVEPKKPGLVLCHMQPRCRLIIIIIVVTTIGLTCCDPCGWDACCFVRAWWQRP